MNNNNGNMAKPNSYENSITDNELTEHSFCNKIKVCL